MNKNMFFENNCFYSNDSNMNNISNFKKFMIQLTKCIVKSDHNIQYLFRYLYENLLYDLLLFHVIEWWMFR